MATSDSSWDELVSAYLDGELKPRQRRRVARAIQESPRLQQLVQAWQADRSARRALPRLATRPELLHAVLTHAPAQPVGGRRPVLSASRGLRGGSLAAAVLLIGLGLATWSSQVHRHSHPNPAPLPSSPEVARLPAPHGRPASPVHPDSSSRDRAIGSWLAEAPGQGGLGELQRNLDAGTVKPGDSYHWTEDGTEMTAMVVDRRDEDGESRLVLQLEKILGRQGIRCDGLRPPKTGELVELVAVKADQPVIDRIVAALKSLPTAPQSTILAGHAPPNHLKSLAQAAADGLDRPVLNGSSGRPLRSAGIAIALARGSIGPARAKFARPHAAPRPGSGRTGDGRSVLLIYFKPSPPSERRTR